MNANAFVHVSLPCAWLHLRLSLYAHPSNTRYISLVIAVHTRIYKIRFILDQINANVKIGLLPGQCLAYDEMMIASKSMAICVRVLGLVMLWHVGEHATVIATVFF